MENNLEDSVIVLSGASGGLGRSCSELLAREGASLGLIDIDEGVREVAHSISKNGGKVIGVTGDITKSIDVDRMVNFILEEYGHITGLVNIAALYRDIPYREFTNIPEEEWDRVMSVNVKGMWLLSKAVVSYMKENGGGSIVNVSSSTFFSGTVGIAHYVASKGAVIGLTRVMAKEMGKFNIRVNSVAPGLLPTEASIGRVTEEYMLARARNNALGRLAHQQEISYLIKFLISNESSSITGQTILADAGGLLY